MSTSLKLPGTTAERSPDTESEAGPEGGRTGRIGLAVGPLLAVALFLVLPDSLDSSARTVAAISLWMGIWWVTEPVPVAVTSLLPLTLFPLLGVAPVEATAAPYANSVVFLVLGGVLLGLATQRWDLHRRVALVTILAMGTKPAQIVLGLMLASAAISMWVSNTATAVIMMPIGISILALINSLDGAHATPKLCSATLLGIAYGVTIGSMSTLIGQPPMPMMKAYLLESQNIDLSFGKWMLIGVPYAAFMLAAAWLVLTKLVFRSEVDEIPGGRELILEERAKLGAMTTQERRVLAVFAAAVFFWVFVPFIADIDRVAELAPWLLRIDDTSVAIAAAVLMFLIPAGNGTAGPLLTWDAATDVPWGVLLLFGGGLTLSSQFTDTGLSTWIGERVASLTALPDIALIMVAVITVLLLSELASNTAMAAAFLPIMGSVAVGVGIDPLLMTIAVTLGLSSAFMLPVGTPSSAVAFATGRVPMMHMVRAGVLLNCIAVVAIACLLYTLVPLVFGVHIG